MRRDRWDSVVLLTVALGAFGLADLGGLARVYAEADSETDQTRRTIRFPADRSVGKLSLARQDDSNWYPYLRRICWVYWGYWGWEYLCEAKGNVTVPAGAKVKLTLSANGASDLSWVAELGADDLYALSTGSIGYVEGTKFRDTDLQHLSGLTGLRELMLPHVPVSDRGLRAIEAFRSLKLLWLRSPRVGNAGVKRVAKLKSLETLSLYADRLSDAGLAHLSELKSLKQLSLTIANVRGPGLEHLARLPSLRHLGCGGEELGDTHLAHLKDATSLRALRIQASSITDEGLAHVSNLTQLEYLDLWHTHVTDAGLVHLKPLRSLKRLNIRSPDSVRFDPLLTAKGMALLAEMQSLEHLDLPNFGMTDECLAHVAKLKNLKYLWAGCSRPNSPISDVGFRHVAKLRHLEQLYIGGAGITNKGIRHIADLTNLKVLNLVDAPGLTNDGLAHLGKLKSLQMLNLPRGVGVTLSGLAHLNSLVNLGSLRAGGVEPPAFGEDTLNIAGLARLEQLTLPSVRDRDLACLAKLKDLRSLGTGYANTISDAGMAHLTGLRSMERLYIGGRGMTDKGLACMANMSKLNHVTTNGNFTDEGLRHLERLKALAYLKMHSGTWVSSGAIKRLRKSLSGLDNFNVDRERGSGNRTKESVLVGRRAPKFKATTLDGKKIRLEDYRGKVLLLYFWAVSDNPCRNDIRAIKRSYERLSQYDGFAMISLSLDVDGKESRLRRQITKHDLVWPQVRLGPDSKIAASYDVRDVPCYVVVGRNGKILHHGHRRGQRFEEALRQVLEHKGTRAKR